MSGLVAIHQPNFYPWLGYFHKLRHADRFVLLDTVQFPKTGGSWGNRAKLLIGGTPRWFTMPIARAYHGVRTFREMTTRSDDWRDDLLKTLRASYGRAAAFGEVFSVVRELVENPAENLTDYNVAALRVLASRLEIDPGKLILASELSADGQATDLLVALVRACGGSAYLCGGGSGGYLEPEKFAQAGLELIYQNFAHPTYQQGEHTPFVPGLSCLDALMHNGWTATARLLDAPAGANRAA